MPKGQGGPQLVDLGRRMRQARESILIDKESSRDGIEGIAFGFPVYGGQYNGLIVRVEDDGIEYDVHLLIKSGDWAECPTCSDYPISEEEVWVVDITYPGTIKRVRRELRQEVAQVFWTKLAIPADLEDCIKLLLVAEGVTADPHFACANAVR